MRNTNIKLRFGMATFIIAVVAMSSTQSFAQSGSTGVGAAMEKKAMQGSSSKEAMQGSGNKEAMQGSGNKEAMQGSGNKETMQGSGNKESMQGSGSKEAMGSNSKETMGSDKKEMMGSGKKESMGSGKKEMMNKQVAVGLEGYCPVCVVKYSQWVKGEKEHRAVYDGVAYYFPSAEVMETFQKNPVAYVPVLRGDCIVCYAHGGDRVPGNIRFAALSKERLFLFPNEEQRQAFKRSPAQFESTDLAANGKCVVCKAKGGNDVSGRPEFTAIHDGFRYQFPSERELQVFAAAPADFIASESGMLKPKMDGSSTKSMDNNGSSTKMMKGSDEMSKSTS